MVIYLRIMKKLLEKLITLLTEKLSVDVSAYQETLPNGSNINCCL